ncbi:hypothetical protein QJU43_05140 [Pasteurella atlantica]|uniref:hypothetical protein n=1 Tax=Pasteurellaceae TaxID=712 RepID=UPI002779DFB5|nr:hypothetical protein [Pasteurella atlantica]MDP8034270.1 hypothetical protein [Pasteurella atlantica]MDP8036203.1 hypothetical protein [Pasteurella atlantica]MDP8038153.1 hypothetical protein [Pasteurella atlantica]MDP8048508.1 hypothetical protein [Pasteurella atlantica]MDP8050427.1 hypothetical protein [Pasteurella atlantica]
MITVDYINQGNKDYLGAEISINDQIICLIGISDELTLFIEFFHEIRILKMKDKPSVDLNNFLEIIKECECELNDVIKLLKEE